MANQPRYDPLEPSDFFADGMAARPRDRGDGRARGAADDPFFDTGKINGATATAFRSPVAAQLLDRGQERFNIYCSECHGRLGDGNGMIPSRGYRRPPSFHTDALRTAKTGHFFDVMTNGFGAMPPYASQIPPSDRWAIVAYIRALQLSQNAHRRDVPPASCRCAAANAAPPRRIALMRRLRRTGTAATGIARCADAGAHRRHHRHRRLASSASSSTRRSSSAPICRGSSSGS